MQLHYHKTGLLAMKEQVIVGEKRDYQPVYTAFPPSSLQVTTAITIIYHIVSDNCRFGLKLNDYGLPTNFFF